MKKGFSLVELSIVLVILGLLTGGILAGQSLIRAAELRVVTTEFNAYQVAMRKFQDKYYAIPGDMADATLFWNAMTGCGTTSVAGTGTETCDGNGNGLLQGGAGGDTNGELFTFWQHLANAGLIEGSYTGIAGPSDNDTSLIGVNVPRSKLTDSGWSIYGTITGDNYDATSTLYFEGSYSNTTMVFGAEVAADETRAPTLRPDEAWNIDKKVDDGGPGTGKVVADESSGPGNCHDHTPGPNPASGASYLYTNTDKACHLIVR